jgi:hypothetical protein
MRTLRTLIRQKAAVHFTSKSKTIGPKEASYNPPVIHHKDDCVNSEDVFMWI